MSFEKFNERLQLHRRILQQEINDENGVKIQQLETQTVWASVRLTRLPYGLKNSVIRHASPSHVHQSYLITLRTCDISGLFSVKWNNKKLMLLSSPQHCNNSRYMSFYAVSFEEEVIA